MVFETIASAVGLPGLGAQGYRTARRGPTAPYRMPYPDPVTQAPTSRRTVVIAEDEVLIRMDLAEMLEEEGYDVVGQAGDGQTAIEVAVSRFAELSHLEAEVAGLTERLDTRKAVDRAKGVLQEQLSLSEPE